MFNQSDTQRGYRWHVGLASRNRNEAMPAKPRNYPSFPGFQTRPPTSYLFIPSTAPRHQSPPSRYSNTHYVRPRYLSRVEVWHPEGQWPQAVSRWRHGTMRALQCDWGIWITYAPMFGVQERMVLRESCPSMLRRLVADFARINREKNAPVRHGKSIGLPARRPKPSRLISRMRNGRPCFGLCVGRTRTGTSRAVPGLTAFWNIETTSRSRAHSSRRTSSTLPFETTVRAAFSLRPPRWFPKPPSSSRLT